MVDQGSGGFRRSEDDACDGASDARGRCRPRRTLGRPPKPGAFRWRRRSALAGSRRCACSLGSTRGGVRGRASPTLTDGARRRAYFGRVSDARAHIVAAHSASEDVRERAGAACFARQRDPRVGVAGHRLLAEHRSVAPCATIAALRSTMVSGPRVADRHGPRCGCRFAR
jgi:hypothetical protein